MNHLKTLIGFLLLSVALLSGGSYWIGQTMAVRYLPLIDAVMEIKLEATTAHLWFEEIISGDRDENLDSVWAHLDLADWHTKAMLEGSSKKEMSFEALREPELVEKIKKVQIYLFEFRAMAHLRLENLAGTAGVGSLADQSFDKVFANLILQTDEVERALHRHIASSLESYRLIQITLQLGILGLGGILFWVVSRYSKQASEMVLAANKANLEKSKFLTMMSHELRTPMNGVIGMAQLLRDTKLAKEQQVFCKVILDSGNSLINILSDILDLSKIEAARETVIVDSFFLKKLVLNNLDLFSGTAKAKGIDLIYIDDSRVQDFVSGDSEILRRILSNLIGNAVKFTMKGKVEVALQLLEATPGQQRVRFEVRDTGIGITEAQKELIFEPFRQADEETTKQFGGTGLGLSIVKGLVELLGSEIQVKNNGLQGSSFVFDLTFGVLENQNRDEEEKGKKIDKLDPIYSHLKLLVVEDDPVNAQVIGGFLKLEKISFDLAKDGEEALVFAENYNYDLILMDLLLPKKDGFTATKEILNSDQSLNRATPIIALTAMVSNEDREKCRALGMKDFLTKPVDFNLLTSKIQKYTKKGS